ILTHMLSLSLSLSLSLQNGSGLMKINYLERDSEWGLTFALLMICLVMNIIFVLFPSILVSPFLSLSLSLSLSLIPITHQSKQGCYHCYLISSNQTSYENNVRFRIPYLRNAPHDALIFDEV